MPRIPGIERPGHFTVRHIPDVQRIMQWIKDCRACRAVVVGGGYIGLEMAEQLVRRGGLSVSLVEATPQVMAPLDPEMAAWLHLELMANGVELHLGDPVADFEEPSAGESARASVVVLKSGHRLPADTVILGLGVRPNVELAYRAGLEIGSLGGIRVNERLQTSDPHIWAVGRDGVDKRIDVLATALKGGMTVHDLAELELAYAPPYGSAKDPVNLAGMAAQNVLSGDVQLAQWDEIFDSKGDGALVLDVRSLDERANGSIPNSLHIPLDELRARFNELPRDREIIVHCQSGQRSYFACRLLAQKGFKVRNLTGSWRTCQTPVSGQI